MKKLKSCIFTSITISTFFWSPVHAQNAKPEYQDNEGLVVMEAENLDSAHLWTDGSTEDGFSGDGYIVWENGQFLNSPGTGIIPVKIKINNPGTYLFQWRSKIGFGTSNTDHNDTWLRFADAADFYGKKPNGSLVYPVGTGKTPNPNGSSKDGWFKIYRSGSEVWTWNTFTSDNNAHSIYVQFDTAGVYTMELSARSSYHIIDRIVLSKDINDPKDLDLEETPFKESLVGIDEDLQDSEKVFIYPSVLKAFSENEITLQSSPHELIDVTIYDASGKISFQQNEIISQGDATKIKIKALIPGHYIVLVKNRSSIKSLKLLII